MAGPGWPATTKHESLSLRHGAFGSLPKTFIHILTETNMHTTLHQELAEVIAHRTVAVEFQPIVNLRSKSIFGYEGLVRGPVESVLHAPIRMFEIALRSGMLAELDYLARELVIEQFSKQDLPGMLFINIHPVTMLHEKYCRGKTLDLLNTAGLDPSRVVIELTETYPIDDMFLMKQAMEHYRGSGFRVALDDLGAGYSKLKLWSEIRPDIVKIDRHFITGINEDRAKQQFITTILKTADALGVQVITEGVENKEEYKTVRKLGIETVQGHYFCRPVTVPPKSPAAKLFRQERRRNKTVDPKTVEDLVKPAFPVQTTTNVYTVGDIFTGTPDLESVVIVQDDEVLGMVLRNEFMNMYASMYGKDLYGKQPIVRFVNRNILQVEKNFSLEDVSYRLTTALDTYTDEFIILDEGKLLGKGKLIDLLHEITSLRIKQARHANPLTLLPGNVPIQEHLFKLSGEFNPYVVCYFDLDNFKPFNDYFGFARGDTVIRFVAELLLANSNEKQDFVGHVGGDDFVIIFCSSDWRSRVDRILVQFDESIAGYYEGHYGETIVACDRKGDLRQYPVMTLSVGAVIVPRHARHYSLDLPGEASVAKHEAKKLKGSVVYIHHIEDEVQDSL